MEKPCGNGSECIADTASGEFSCNCMKGTTGQNCATDINECIEVLNLTIFKIKFEIKKLNSYYRIEKCITYLMGEKIYLKNY